MPPGTPLDFVPLWAVFVATVAGMALCAEAGYRLGRWRRGRATRETEGPVGGLVGAELGLLAFLLAIAFSLAAGRYDDRRRVLLDEANAIGTTYLRAAMLPGGHRDAVRGLLREYVDARLRVAREPGTVEGAVRRSEQIHGELWSHAVAAATADPRSVPAGLFTESLNDLIDLHAKRVQAALRSRLPATVWVVLFGVAGLSFAMMGYHAGLSGAAARSPGIVFVALAFAAAIWLVASLERPHEGLLRVGQQPMFDLRESMNGPDDR